MTALNTEHSDPGDSGPGRRPVSRPGAWLAPRRSVRRGQPRRGPRAGRLPAVDALRPGLVVALAWLLLLIIAAVGPGAFTSRDPLAVEPAARLTGPSWAHPFGTDQLGRDLFARVVHGTGVSLTSALLATTLGLVIGSALGLLAGFRGSWADAVVMRLVDVLLSVPSLLTSLALIAVLGAGTRNIAIAMGLASVATCARITRSEVLRVRESLSVEAAWSSGARWTRILLRHALPNSMGPVWALAALEFGAAILAVSALSFLGYGVRPPDPEWGSLVSAGRDHLRDAWWLTTLPGLTVTATVLAANQVSRTVYDAGIPG
ncbi:ABC transporter permease [Frankia sp. QA3]|uniref:ABC transporter permease n=1 Tax=Frankia sp. QA3 TaxID=710111 RepID=UPI000269C246|nr:ABC transporter permease [Frankia sp. QA3]EIV92801.1 ABC-type dipeptide/oligopeptide/nickel transport system, permease component [Frankia sp. QA3]